MPLSGPVVAGVESIQIRKGLCFIGYGLGARFSAGLNGRLENYTYEGDDLCTISQRSGSECDEQVDVEVDRFFRDLKNL